jgi:DNA-binding MarR family transcriptional regulator
MHASQVLPCNAHALRQATRHVSALYDQALAPYGLRGTQYSILARLVGSGPWTIQALAAKLVTDRTTLGRAVQPLEREGLVRIAADLADGRARVLSITPEGAARFVQATAGWQQAQARYEAAIGPDRAAALRADLKAVAKATF